MHVCFISNQIAAWGKIGGFGSATRALGRGLVQRGVEVTAVVPRRANHGQARVEELDGITVYGTGLRETLTSGRIFREIDADIYHSQEPTLPSYLAMRAAPGARHVVTCRDPRSLADHLVELRHTNYKRRFLAPVTWYYEASPWVKRAVRQADAVFMPAPTCLLPRIQRLYGDQVEAEFLPTPIDLPDEAPQKASEPVVIFVGRWDHRKRIEWFFHLAAEMPDVKFVAVGRAHDSKYDRQLRSRYGHLPNIDMPGYIPRFGAGGLNEVYGSAWVLVNTSVREGLPYTFIEACAWDCCILSGLDPDGFTSSFGYHVKGGGPEAYLDGLRWLLDGKRWKERGKAAGRYVRATFSEENSIDQHLRHYKAALG